jgi:hypothetical protein
MTAHDFPGLGCNIGLDEDALINTAPSITLTHDGEVAAPGLPGGGGREKTPFLRSVRIKVECWGSSLPEADDIYTSMLRALNATHHGRLGVPEKFAPQDGSDTKGQYGSKMVGSIVLKIHVTIAAPRVAQATAQQANVGVSSPSGTTEIAIIETS